MRDGPRRRPRGRSSGKRDDRGRRARARRRRTRLAAVRRFYEAEIEKLGEDPEPPRSVPVGARPDRRRPARLEVAANVASLEEVRLALASGAEGIGLFRTEFLFMNRRQPPSEEEQAHVYSEAARMAAGRPVIFRTLDAGGDKPIPYLGLAAGAEPVSRLPRRPDVRRAPGGRLGPDPGDSSAPRLSER